MTVKGQVRHAFPAYRVYIFGADVTEDVLDVDVRYHVGRSPNTCTITLANELDKYICTTSDLTTLFGKEARDAIDAYVSNTVSVASLSDDPYYAFVQNYQSTMAAEEEALKIQASNLYPEIKRKIITSKITERIDNVEQPDITDKKGGKFKKQLTGPAFKYPFQAEDPIFHANDPIRVFFRHPFDPKRWYHMFCGFLSNFDDHVSENNQKILTITAEGPSKILRYARITTNPGIVDIKAVELSEFDATERSFYSSGFKGLTLPEVIFAIIFGNDPDNKWGGKFTVEQKDADGNKLPKQIRFQGVGNFNYKRSVAVEYGPKTAGNTTSSAITTVPVTSVDNLSTYQSLIDHEVKITDLDELLVEDQVSDAGEATNNEVIQFKNSVPRTVSKDYDVEYIMDFIGRRTDLYPVDGGALVMLLPASLEAEINRDVLLKDILQSVAMVTEFKSRLGMMYDILERLEFVFYESPRGDLICEFPLYDFDPEDFGYTDVPHVVAKQIGKLERMLVENEDIKRGPFGNSWNVIKNDTYNFSKGITDEKIRTQITSPWSIAQGYEATVPNTKGILKPAVITLRHLTPLYWLRLEQINPKGIIASKEAALTFAHITLNKINSDARNLGINTVPNITTWLNRPIFFEQRNCYGVLMSSSHSIKWGMGGSMDTRLNINYIRGWDGLLDADGKPVYTTIGGQASRPLDYKLLFNLKNKVKSSGAEPPGDYNIGKNTSSIT